MKFAWQLNKRKNTGSHIGFNASDPINNYLEGITGPRTAYSINFSHDKDKNNVVVLDMNVDFDAIAQYEPKHVGKENIYIKSMLDAIEKRFGPYSTTPEFDKKFGNIMYVDKIKKLEQAYNDIFDKVPDVNSPITKQIEIIRKQIRTLKDNLNK